MTEGEQKYHQQHDTGVPRDFVEEYGLVTEGEKTSPLLLGKEAAEKAAPPWNPNRRSYGAVPFLKSRDESLALFRGEAAYFGRTYKTKEPGAPPWRDAAYAEGMILYEAKFGEKLSELAEEILSQYPSIEGADKGKVISLFGLSGSGKSTALEALREIYGDQLIEMDSDTVRYNLFGKKIQEVEMENGATLDEVRNHLMHNNISGSMYLLLDHLTKTLKDRGYMIVRSSTMPEFGADAIVYLQHPDGIDPRRISDEEISDKAGVLFARTESRVDGPDDFDWDHRQTVTRFEDMKQVTVQVPQQVHGIFIKNLRGILSNPSIAYKELTNERIDDPTERKKHYVKALRKVIS